MKAFLKLLAVGAILGFASIAPAQANFWPQSKSDDCRIGDNRIECRCKRIDPANPFEWRYLHDRCDDGRKSVVETKVSHDKPEHCYQDRKTWKKHVHKDWKKKNFHKKNGWDKKKKSYKRR